MQQMGEDQWALLHGTAVILRFRLIKTERRLTFDIFDQAECTRWRGDDDGDYPTFTASNGYQVISRSRMDIQTERLWLLGASEDTRSGSMVFSSNEKRDAAYDQFMVALEEWAEHYRFVWWHDSEFQFDSHQKEIA